VKVDAGCLKDMNENWGAPTRFAVLSLKVIIQLWIPVKRQVMQEGHLGQSLMALLVAYIFDEA
jgi:hypothetical protein